MLKIAVSLLISVFLAAIIVLVITSLEISFSARFVLLVAASVAVVESVFWLCRTFFSRSRSNYYDAERIFPICQSRSLSYDCEELRPWRVFLLIGVLLWRFLLHAVDLIHTYLCDFFPALRQNTQIVLPFHQPFAAFNDDSGLFGATSGAARGKFESLIRSRNENVQEEKEVDGFYLV